MHPSCIIIGRNPRPFLRRRHGGLCGRNVGGRPVVVVHILIGLLPLRITRIDTDPRIFGGPKGYPCQRKLGSIKCLNHVFEKIMLLDCFRPQKDFSFANGQQKLSHELWYATERARLGNETLESGDKTT